MTKLCFLMLFFKLIESKHFMIKMKSGKYLVETEGKKYSTKMKERSGYLNSNDGSSDYRMDFGYTQFRKKHPANNTCNSDEDCKAPLMCVANRAIDEKYCVPPRKEKESCDESRQCIRPLTCKSLFGYGGAYCMDTGKKGNLCFGHLECLEPFVCGRLFRCD